MSSISKFRIAALSLSLFLGLVVLGLAVHWIQITTSVIRFTIIYDFEIVALVAGVLTALFLPLMLVVGQIRRGAFISKVTVELVTLIFLYTVTLLVLALVGQSRGNTVWNTSVAEAHFFENKPNNGSPQLYGVPLYIQTPATYPLVTPQYTMVQQYSAGPVPGHSALPQV
ncbi:hypothetical protein C0995_008207 [Termitomyces sp. Mi166|nr:hypothetical protein C0995_008207 [Termitomyces sp. Mi166\